jgi:hypothetical protein
MFAVMFPARARTAACAPAKLHGAASVQAVPPPVGEAHSTVGSVTTFGDAGAPLGGAGALESEECSLPTGSLDRDPHPAAAIAPVSARAVRAKRHRRTAGKGGVFMGARNSKACASEEPQEKRADGKRVGRGIASIRTALAPRRNTSALRSSGVATHRRDARPASQRIGVAQRRRQDAQASRPKTLAERAYLWKRATQTARTASVLAL